jgi:hypothetical protein
MENQTLTTTALEDLRAENARLIALLEAHGIAWRIAPESPVSADEAMGHQPVEKGSSDQAPESSRLSTAEKVALFRRLFRGRADVYPIRWEGKTSGKTGAKRAGTHGPLRRADDPRDHR